MNTLMLSDNENDIEIAGNIIRYGGLVAFPTETVYGLGASAYDPKAAKKIYAAKGRPSDNPLIVHVCSREQIRDVAQNLSDEANKIIDSFMPGPITVILNKKPRISNDVTAGLSTVAVRFPDNATAQRVIKSAGVPVAAPSANISGRPSPTTARDVAEDMNGRIDAIIDGGECRVGVESTIVDTTGEIPTILRPGGITLKMLNDAGIPAVYDKKLFVPLGKDEKPKCPGMKYKHYAPKADVYVIEGEKDAVQDKIKALIRENHDKKIGVLFMHDAVYDDAVMLFAGHNTKEYAHNLFKALREFDRLGIDVIYAEFSEDDGYGQAVKNRLYKSAANRVMHV